MLYFSKIRISLILIFTVIISYFAFLNFIPSQNEFKRTINLGLDLQGGSYLLLEVDNNPVITQKLQNKLIEIKKETKSKNLLIRNIKIDNQVISFEFEQKIANDIKEIFEDKKSELNPYYSQFKTHQLDL